MLPHEPPRAGAGLEIVSAFEHKNPLRSVAMRSRFLSRYCTAGTYSASVEGWMASDGRASRSVLRTGTAPVEHENVGAMVVQPTEVRLIETNDLVTYEH